MAHHPPALGLSLTFPDEPHGTESVELHREHRSVTLPKHIIITAIIITVVLSSSSSTATIYEQQNQTLHTQHGTRHISATDKKPI